MSNSTYNITERVAEALAERDRRVKVARRRDRAQRAGYRIAEFSAALGINNATTQRWLKRGIVRAVHIAGSTIIPASELDRLMAEGSPKGRKRMSARTADGKFVKAEGAAP
jgi:hypothetical protein